MTIREYVKNNPDFDIYRELELDFAEPENETEAIANIQWVLENEPNYDALCIVVRSYYGGTISW